MTYQRFEDLPVWQQAAQLYEAADDFLETAPPRLRHSARDQLERAVFSVSNNIAEGFERGTTNELLSFLYIARGSAGEVRSMLCLLERRPWMKDFKSEISNLKSQIMGAPIIWPLGWLAEWQSPCRQSRHGQKHGQLTSDYGPRTAAIPRPVRRQRSFDTCSVGRARSDAPYHVTQFICHGTSACAQSSLAYLPTQ